MSAGDFIACIQGLLLGGTCRKMIPPDNRCCFCLNLRVGVLLIGIVNFALYLLAFSWYIGNVGFSGDFEAQISNIDISVFVLFCIQLLVNLLLIIGAAKRIPHHTFPWLCSNAVVIAIIMVLIFMLVFLGTSRNNMSYREYVSYISILSLLAGTDMFCCIVVFQFRRNLILQARIDSEESGNLFVGSAPPCCPPPAYEEAAPSPPSLKVPLEDPPPEYEAAIAMLCVDEERDRASGPHLRKKSLTTDQV